MNKVILESSIDDKLDSITYMIESENKDKKEKKKKDPELVAKRKKLLKRIGVVIGVGTAIIVIIQTIRKAKYINKAKTAGDNQMAALNKAVDEIEGKIKDGIKELEDMKKDISSDNMSPLFLKTAEKNIEDVYNEFMGHKQEVTEIQKNMAQMDKNIKDYKKLNTITSSAKKLNQKSMSLNADFHNNKTKLSNINKTIDNDTMDRLGDLKLNIIKRGKDDFKATRKPTKSLFDEFK